MCRQSVWLSLCAGAAVLAAVQLNAALTISGTVVRSSDMSPLPNATVRLFFNAYGNFFDEIFDLKTEILTDENGNFTFNALQKGYYGVDFSFGGFYQAYANQTSLYDATPFWYPGGTMTFQAGAWLPVCSVSGTVTGPNGAPLLSPIPVQVFRYCEIEGEAGVLRGETVTDADGHFTVDGLPENGYAEVVFGNNWDSADYYVLGMDSMRSFFLSGTTQLEAVTLDRVGITGTVTGPDGTTPLPGIAVNAWIQDAYGEWQVATATITDACGRYTLDARDAGMYSVAFEDPSGDHLPEFYDDGSDPNSSTIIHLQYARSVVTGIDASLASSAPPAASIAGTVTGANGTPLLQGIEATAYRWAGSSWKEIATTETAANGSYSLVGVPPGTYCVVFTDQQNGTYAREVYAGAPDLISGTAFVVPDGTSVTGINASLETASWITGTVTAPNGLLTLAGIEVAAYRRSDTGEEYVWIRSAVTGSDGHYAIGGLPAGTYRVLFADWLHGLYVRQTYTLEMTPLSAPVGALSPDGGPAATALRVPATEAPDGVVAAAAGGFNGALDLEAGSDIVLAGNSTIADVDASLATAARISGTVTGPGGATPLMGINAVAYRWRAEETVWEWMGAAVTDADGDYAIGGLPAGTYRVQFSDTQAGAYAGEVYNEAADLASGSNIVVLSATDVVGIDASLATTSKIVGRLSGPDGVSPLPNVDAEAYRQNDSGGDWQWMGGTLSDENGDYTLSGLPGGTYRVRFRDALLGNYVSEYYNGAADLAAAADILVGAGATTTGISASLAEASAAIPEIDVLGNAVSIADGDDSPIPVDHTDYGSTREAGGVVVRTYVVMNLGNAPLVLTGNPCVTLSGTHAADFTVTQQPAASVAPGGAATFQVTFDPLAPGCRTATLSIASDDGNENPCSFVIQGKGLTPPGVLAPLREPEDDGFVIQWTSAADHLYTLHHSTNLLHGFSLLQTGIPATPPINTYTDHVQRATSKFWKITAE